jgi:hypothetical protein
MQTRGLGGVSANSRKFMSVECDTQKKSISGLKSSEQAFVFSNEDPQMKQINDHRVGFNRGIARGITHGLISYRQSHKMISPFAFSATGTSKRQGVTPPLHFETPKPEARNVKAPKSHFGILATGSSIDKGVTPPLHRESPKPETRNVSCLRKVAHEPFSISAIGMSRDKG